jgi:hypothetical protein
MSTATSTASGIEASTTTMLTTTTLMTTLT